MSVQNGWIEVRKTKRGTVFLLRYRVRDDSRRNGWRTVSETLEGCKTRKEAVKERQRRIKSINKANECADGSSISISFRQFVEDKWKPYLRRKGRKQSTISGYQSLLQSRIMPYFGSMRLKAITPTQVSDFLDGLPQEQGPKILNVYTLLHTMFELALESDLIETNPVRKKLHRPEYKAPEKPILKPAQVSKVISQIPVEWKALILAVALTTLRIGELLALKWSDIDWENLKVHVHDSIWRGKLEGSTKTGVNAKKHLPPVLAQALLVHRSRSQFQGDNDFVFCRNDGSPCDPGHLRKQMLYPALDRAGIVRGKRTHGFHLFRHTGGSVVRAVTGDMKLAQIQVGHASISTTADVYVHTDDKDLERASDVLVEAYGLDNLPTDLPTKPC